MAKLGFILLVVGAALDGGPGADKVGHFFEEFDFPASGGAYLFFILALNLSLFLSRKRTYLRFSSSVHFPQLFGSERAFCSSILTSPLGEEFDIILLFKSTGNPHLKYIIVALEVNRVGREIRFPYPPSDRRPVQEPGGKNGQKRDFLIILLWN